MCAISGYYLLKSSKIEPKKLVEISVKLLRAGQNRGRDACGFYANGKIVKQGKTFSQAHKVLRELKKIIAEKPRIALFHNRQATQGSPTNNANNHPLRVEKWVAIHNGIISNYVEKRDKLKLNWDENVVDSLLIPYILNRSEKENNISKIRELRYVSGSLACGLVNEEYPKTLYLVSDGVPLVVAFIPKYKILLFASEEKMILEAISNFRKNWLGYFKEGYYCPSYVKAEITDKIVKISERGYKVFETWENDAMGYRNWQRKESGYSNDYGWTDANGVWHRWEEDYPKLLGEDNPEETKWERFDKKVNDEVMEKYENGRLRGI